MFGSTTNQATNSSDTLTSLDFSVGFCYNGMDSLFMSTKNTSQNSPGGREGSTTGSVRKLAAIMFTDMKGFSRKMGKDESATMRLLKTHNQMMQEVVAKHGGSVIKTVGDAFLVSFESVVTAVRCAIEVQQAFHDYNKGKFSEEQIVIRIGVHVGDIIVEANDVFGDGVNIAARIQPLASPGGVCISEDVARQMRGKLDYPLMKLGKGELKNIDIPVVIYKVVLPWEKAKLPAVQQLQFVLKQKQTRKYLFLSVLGIAALAWLFFQTSIFKTRFTASDLTIAVVPFVNIGDPTNDYLSDGITEDIISHLAADSNLVVISKTSSFTYKGSKKADSTIAAELSVRFLLKGILQLTETGVKMKTMMFDAKLNKESWSENFEASRAEIFQTQEQIPQKVALFFDLNFATFKLHRHKIVPEVYEPYLKGLYSARQPAKDANALAIEYFQETLKLDSLFVPALVSLADAQSTRYQNAWDQSPTILADAEMYCRKALRLDTTNANAYAVLGVIENLKGNQPQALENLRRAITLDPNNPGALTILAKLYLINLNEPAKAITHLKRLQEIEPTSSIVNSNLGVGYGQLKNYPDAIRAFQKAIQLDPENATSWTNLGYSYERIGQYDSALQCYKTAIQKNPMDPLLYENSVTLLLARGQFAAAEAVLTVGTRFL